MYASMMAQSASPEIIGSAGDHSISSSGAVSWTIGEPVTDSYYGTNNIITKGFHQPKIISVISVPDINLEQSVYLYPNPVINNLTLDFTKMQAGKYDIDIYDVAGQIVKNLIVTIGNEEQQENIDLTELTDGLYFIRIINEIAEKNKIFRIIKQ
jgi:hypothetical protein